MHAKYLDRSPSKLSNLLNTNVFRRFYFRFAWFYAALTSGVLFLILIQLTVHLSYGVCRFCARVHETLSSLLKLIVQGRIQGEGAGGAPPPWDEALFFVFAFKICLPHRSGLSFLKGAPILRKILDPPLWWSTLVWHIISAKPREMLRVQIVYVQK